MEKAVKERVFYVNRDGTWQEPNRPSLANFLLKVSTFTNRFVKNTKYSIPLNPREFANTFQDRRRTIYNKAVDSLMTCCVNIKDAWVKAFLKIEKYLFKKEKIPVNRVIQPRDSRYIVHTGRYIKPIEKLIYENVNSIFSSTTVFKGMNAQDRGNVLYSKWTRFRNPVAVGLDASRFDQCVSNSALQWEHSMYQKYYPGDKFFKWLMSLQRNNKGKAYTADGKLSYHTKHNRMSGDSNTSVGNVLIMCALVYTYLHEINLDAELVNDGDDCVLIFERESLHLLETLHSWFSEAGFNMVAEDPVYVFEEIEFCQSHPVFDMDGGYTMVRNPHVSISKDCVAIKPLDNIKVRNMWLSAVGQGGISLTAGMPILPEFYQVFLRNSNGAKALSDPTLETGTARLSKGMKRKHQEPSDATRVSFWKAFGISPSNQVIIEQYYREYIMGSGNEHLRFIPLPFS